MHRETARARLLVVFVLLAILTLTALSPLPSRGSDLGLVEADCRCCHGTSLADRHHLLVPSDGLECLGCHPVTYNDITLQYNLSLLRDCLQCHSGSLADRHHALTQPGDYDCLDCHALFFNPQTLAYQTTFRRFCEETQQQSPAPLATVTGAVTDQNGSGLAWATVATEDGSHSALTSETGDYQLNDLAAGEHILVATHAGYVSLRQTVSVTPPQTPAVQFALATNPVEKCGDGLDNDGNGLIDCDDPECLEAGACLAAPAERCADGIDNDGNGLADCDDPDCSATSTCLPPPVEICGDGFDNDGNGLADCADPKCQNGSTCPGITEPEPVPTGTDDRNDLPGPLQSDRTVTTYTRINIRPIEFCSNGFDEDNDGLIDCSDPDCRRASACRKAETAETCDNGIDDDGDGRIDGKDRECKKDRNDCPPRSTRARASRPRPEQSERRDRGHSRAWPR